jgi:signal peptidase II
MQTFIAWRWVSVSLIVLLLDQWSKWLVVSHFNLGELYPVLPMMHIALTYNHGIAFSWFDSSALWVRQLLNMVSMAIVVFLLYVQNTTARGSWRLQLALALMIGGALGNILDKVAVGYVVDFIDVYYGNWHFATFNIADAAISIGGICFAYDAWITQPKTASPAA